MALTDTRQAARLRTVPQLPSSPPPPDLAALYAEHKPAGLTEVFRRFDQDHRDWAQKIARQRQTADQALHDAAARSGKTYLPDAGWATLDFVPSLIGYASSQIPASQGGYGRAIGIEVMEWRLDWRASLTATGIDLDRYMASFYLKQKALYAGPAIPSYSTVYLAPRTFSISFDESTYLDPIFGTRGRLVPRIDIIPGDDIVSPTGQTFKRSTDALQAVVRRVGPGTYTAWLQSVETESPSAKENLHAGAIRVSLH